VAVEGFGVLDESRALLCPFRGFLLDFVAGERPAFGTDGLADAFVTRALREAGDLADFLRVFLDIRLPFVAFRGSIIAVLRSMAGRVSSAFFRIMLKRISTRHPSARVA
jgi:hypothetical protein